MGIRSLPGTIHIPVAEPGMKSRLFSPPVETTCQSLVAPIRGLHADPVLDHGSVWVENVRIAPSSPTVICGEFGQGRRPCLAVTFWIRLANSNLQILFRTCKVIFSLFCPYRYTCAPRNILRYGIIKMSVIQVFHLYHVFWHTVYFRKELVTWVWGITFGWVAKGPPST